MTPRRTEALNVAEQSAVRTLAASVAAADGVAALSEESLIGLTRSGPAHLLLESGGELTAYAQVWVDGTAELLVAPGHRRQGQGTDLWSAAGAGRCWAHGDLPPARALAGALGLGRLRELHRMTRPLTSADVAPVLLPDPYAARPFVPGRDEGAWLATNAAAFAGHPEQGRVGPADLDGLMGQPWFDPAGFLLVDDPDDPSRIAAFHWTKVEDGVGQVFVVGIHPAHQGRGLAGPVTRLGLAHLAGQGLPLVDLYVDGLNERAVRTYTRLGFTIASTDVMYGTSLTEAARMRG